MNDKVMNEKVNGIVKPNINSLKNTSEYAHYL